MTLINKSNLSYHLAALLAVSAWGGSFIVTKILLQHGLNPVETYVYRFIIAYLCVFCICPKPLFTHSFADELKFILIGLSGGSIYFIAENTAMKYTLVTNVSLITTTSPLLSTILLGLLYKNEKPNRWFIIGSIIAFLGVGFVIFNSSFALEVNPLGDLLALLAAFCWAFYTILLRPVNAIYSAWFITRKTFFYGVITAMPFLAVEPSHVSLATLTAPVVIGNLLLLALIASVLSYVIWAETVKHLGVMITGNYLYFSPIVTLILSALFLNESVSWVGYTGCALILIGMVISERLNKARK